MTFLSSAYPVQTTPILSNTYNQYVIHTGTFMYRNSSADMHTISLQFHYQIRLRNTKWDMRTVPLHDGRVLHTAFCILETSPAADRYAVLSAVIEHLSVVSCFMMCAVGPGILRVNGPS